ncbi:MAG: aconitase/3-isopropylmalate dehydratase large subunit family protein [Gammaproteobacteria bacterium]|jgi:3-isopropylmalate/(R)-2-methylmalate dehydratase large subunit|nr:homoaconitate hydratase family protein [Gammaproteobacteria bacterium]MDP7154281.1 aconitase/3-isopropylmalate dehydratase large subunit family protein [Gammaproteobacteria bacterium]MDP7296133.1 aconitase/3-isopropylmalate dehydratase large subunit family protein [Gammaproteobacteria bacterium]MDP7419524.1 aconitase/3-isopropylmalate dehydratase large subunit family protein [Gammaproteobacteria bacterium]MDP7660243.1 aconitase/3-isopropylmalate dehydratase large subunit family protein [Gamm
MGYSIAEKIIAGAAGRDSVVPGEIVTCKVDLALLLDSGGPRRIWPRLKELGVGVWDPDKIVIATDHFTPAVDAESAAILQLTRDFVREFKIPRFFDMQGIGHVVLAEHGIVQPGMFACGGDSHSSNGGAFGCYMVGFGAIEMTGIVVTGEIWLQVPETVRVNWSGAFSPGVAAKDIMLMLCRELGINNAFKVIEFGGDTVAAMSMNERATLTNMAAEMGAETGIVEPDDTTLAAIRAGGQAPDAAALDWCSDADTDYEVVHNFVATELAPQVAAPHSPANSGSVSELTNVGIDQAYIGACVGAKLSDLHMVAEVLKGRTVAGGTRLLVAPASQQVLTAATTDGTLKILVDAGAYLLPTGCGACAALGAGILAEDEVCISSTNRNFKGRMGANSASVYLGSPYTVAASAVAGRIADPREMLA